MPKRMLTDRFCASAKAAAGAVQTDYFDSDCIGLALRVGATGARSWSYLFTFGGRRVRMTLGTYPVVGLAHARTLADEARTAIEKGHDPRLSAQATNLDAVLDEFVKRHVRQRLRRPQLIERAFAMHVRPRLGHRSIYDLKRRDIVAMLDAIDDGAGPVMADRTLAYLRKAFNWQAARDDEFKSPIVRGMARVRPSDRARARTLTDDEIRLVWRTAEGQGPFGRLVRFLLLTGARRTEAASMRWDELDGADWTLPAARNKTKLDLLRPLPKPALAVIGDREAEGVFVFTNDGVRAIRGYGELKAMFDRATGPMERWTLHDLRRTARSLMSRAGVHTDHAERVLGHVIGGVRGVYDRHEYRDEKAQALSALARLIDRIISGRPTVLRLQRVEAGAYG
jgi:integrase